MAARRISAIVIKIPGGKDAYIITAGDIIRWIVKHPDGIRDVLAREVMNGPITPVNAQDSISTAIDVMHSDGFKRVVVQDDAGELMGIITIHDILSWNFINFRPATPMVLLVILKDSGEVLFRYDFPGVQQLSLLDPDLLGASITAIMDLIDELFQESSNLKVLRKKTL